jgi:tetratricopeptide (TPR) repeat protein
LVEASLPEVIKLLAYSLKSGCLSVTDRRNFGNIFLKDGRIIYATILNRNVRLFDTMIDNDLLKRNVLDEALRLQKKKRKRVGEILIELGAISKQDLEGQLRQQIETTIYEMLAWSSGFFNFEENLLPGSEEFTIDLSAQQLLLTSARRVSDWQQIENNIPPKDIVLVRSEGRDAASLEPPEGRVLEGVDGSRSIGEVIKRSGLDFQEACKAVYVLLAAGFLEKPKKPTEARREPSGMTEYQNIGYALYKTGKYDESEREFKKVLDNEPDNAEAIFYLGLIEMMREHHAEAKRNLDAALEIEERLSILINVGYLCNKMGWYDDALQYLNQAQTIDPDNSKVILNLAITHYNRGDLNEAAGLFEQSLHLYGHAATPFIYLARISEKKGNIEEAVGWLRQALGKFPRSIMVKNNLALLYVSTGEYEDAEKLYCDILAVKPDNPVVMRNLADLYYRLNVYGVAREYYEQIPDEKRDHSLLVNLGHICLAQGDRAHALSLWEQARDLLPDDQDVNQNIEALQAMQALGD